MNREQKTKNNSRKTKTKVYDDDKAVGVNILIKKYENRRLYSVNHKRYITLDDISEYVNEGKKIKVVEVFKDSDVESNITCEILLQILLQQGKSDLIPQDVLELMVRMNNAWLKKFWSPYFEKAIRAMVDLNPLLSGTTQNIFKNWFVK